MQSKKPLDYLSNINIRLQSLIMFYNVGKNKNKFSRPQIFHGLYLLYHIPFYNKDILPYKHLNFDIFSLYLNDLFFGGFPNWF